MLKFRKYLVAVFATLLAVAASAADVPYGKNLLQNTNPDGTTFDPWSKTDGGSGWAISDGKFCSSYMECVLTQTVNLKDLKLTTGQTDSLTMLSIVNYEIPWPGDYECIAKVIITCKDSDGNNLSVQSLLDINQSNIEVSATLATKSFLLPKGTTQLVYEVHGKSQKSWGGQYGPRFWCMYIGFVENMTKTYTASAVATLGDSLVLSKTAGIKVLDTIDVTSKYSDVRIKILSSENSNVISSNQVVCMGADMTINAEFYRKHSIVASASEYGTITIKKDMAFYGDTIVVSHTMNSDTVLFAGYTTTPDINWLTDSTFIMVDENVTVGMEVYRRHSIVASASEYGTIAIKKDAAIYGDTVIVSHTMNCDTVRFAGYATTPNVNWLNDSAFIMANEDVTVGMEVYRRHSIVASSSEYATIAIKKDAAIHGDTITVSHTMNCDTVYFAGYTATSDLTWVNNSTFIMPDEDVTIGMEVIKVHGIPFCDGFEKGNMQDQKIAGWLQQSESGDDSWTANSTETSLYFTPYSGSWNAMLYCGNTDWLFTPVNLVKGTKYMFSTYAKQDGSNVSSPTISAKIGTAADKDSMKQIVLAETGVVRGDYQRIVSIFTADTGGVCWLGIRGYVDNRHLYVSIDSVCLKELESNKITTDNKYGTIKVKKSAMYGDTIVVSHTMNSDTVRFVGYTTKPDLTWVNDSTFIMVDEDVTVGMEVMKVNGIPFCDGFENGNTQGQKIAGWLQQSEYGDNSWTANSTETTRNRTPYSGDWNATLIYSNIDWLFTPVNLVRGERYVFSVYARLENVSSSVNISAKIGTAADKDSMKQVVLAETGVVNGDYQHIEGFFTADMDGVCWLGIRGYNPSYYFLSIDSVCLEKSKLRKITTDNKYGTINIKGSAMIGDTITVRHTMNSDTVRFAGYTTTPNLTWLNDSTFIMADEDVTFGMEVYRKHSIVASSSEYGTITIKKDAAIYGDTITVRHTMNSDTVLFSGYTTTPDLTRVNDSTFIMANEDVTVGMEVIKGNGIPFYDGFETGNLQKWIQQSESGTDSWTANTETYSNRTPYSGSWNATLQWNNTDWLFTPVNLVKGEMYVFSIYARQSSRVASASYAKISAMIGTAADKDSMKQVVLSETGVTNGDYQHIVSSFTADTDGTCWLGIRGYISNEQYFYISIDSVSLEKAKLRKITTDNKYGTINIKGSAMIGDTIIVRHTMKSGYIFRGYITTPNLTRVDDSTFIMPDEDVTIGMEVWKVNEIPFYDGFENGNTQGQNIVGWLQQSEYGSNSWIANNSMTSYNRSPYSGSWNALLHYSNTDWLFTPVNLAKGTKYVFSIYARQNDSNASYAKISAKIGTAADKDSMKQVVLAETGVNGDYQHIVGSFIADTGGVCWLGIRGYINNICLSIDNVSLAQEGWHTVVVESKFGACDVKQWSFKDDIVTINRTMKPGYAFTGYTTTPEVKWTSSDFSSFIMPDEDVIITMNAEKIDYSISVGGTEENGSVATNVNTAQVDDIVKLTITPAIGYTLDEITISQNGDKLVFNAEDSTFVMPADSVEISATFKKIDYTILVKESENGTVTSSDDIAQIDDIVKLNITSVTGYTLDEITISQNGDKLAFNAEDSTFVMLAGNVEISATFKKIDYSILVHESENGTVTTNATAQMDDVVKLAITSAVGYTLDEITITQNGDMVTFNAEDSTFVMPADSVEISATFKKIDYTILVKESENGTVTSSDDIAQIDDIVKLNITSAVGYTLDEIIISQNGDKVAFNAEDSTFVMSAGNVEISATFKKIDYTILVHESENGTVTSSVAIAQMDDVVKLAITPAVGYTLDEIIITQNGDKVAFNAEDSTFVMPADSVEISATFKKIDYTILVKESENGTIISSAATAQIDDIVKLNITSVTGYTLDEITISQNGDKLAFNAEDSSFIMLAGNVEISATFKKIDYTILVHESENGTVTSSVAIAQMDDVVKLAITPAVGYTLDEIIITQNGDKVAFNAEDSTFVMSVGNVEISATFKKIDYNITIAEAENGSVVSNKATAQIGDTVKLTITPDSDFDLDKLVITQGETQVNFNAEDSTFVMPAGDVTITATFKQSTDVEDVKVLNLYVADGRIYCEGEFRIFDLLGRDVTAMNGSLRGVYVVRTKDAFRKVIVK